MLENVMKFFAVRFVFSSLSLSLHSLSPRPTNRFPPLLLPTSCVPFGFSSPPPSLFFLFRFLSPPPFPPVLMFFYSVFVTEMHSAHSTLIKFNLTSKTVPLFPTNEFTWPRGQPPWIIAANSYSLIQSLFDLIINH